MKNLELWDFPFDEQLTTHKDKNACVYTTTIATDTKNKEKQKHMHAQPSLRASERKSFSRAV